MRTIVYYLFLICGTLVVNMMFPAFSLAAAAQENLIENGDFSQGLQDWTVGFPTNPCKPGNLSERGGYYGCVMVTDEGTPGNPHLELYTGTGGEYGMERFEQGVTQTLSRLPKDAGRITMSLRVWSLGNTSYVRTLIQTRSNENLTREEMYDVQGDWFESYYYPSREPTTITRDITNFHDPTTYLIVAGDRVAVDDITIVATPSSPEPIIQTELIKNGGFSQGLEYWEQNPFFCCGKVSEEKSPGNPHLELLGGSPGVTQEVHLPEDATRISLSIKAWALTPPGQNPENVMPWVEVRITHEGSIFNGTVDQDTYSIMKPALRMDPAITITRDLTGFKGENITLTLMGEEAAVDDATLLANTGRSFQSLPPTNPQTSNATLEYDLTNRFTENATTCTYEWGPMFTLYRTPDEFSFNFSSTSAIDVYVFPSDWYNDTVSCSLGPILRAPYTPDKLPTGKEGLYGLKCSGCEMEGGKALSSYVLFINRDAMVTPHVMLEVAVKLHATTTTTMVTPPPSAIPFIGVPEVLLAILLGLFVVVRRRSRGIPPRTSHTMLGAGIVI